jgi:hypothetical protein
LTATGVENVRPRSEECATETTRLAAQTSQSVPSGANVGVTCVAQARLASPYFGSLSAPWWCDMSAIAAVPAKSRPPQIASGSMRREAFASALRPIRKASSASSSSFPCRVT